MEEILDQLHLAKNATQKSLGHISRVQQLLAPLMTKHKQTKKGENNGNT
jgi:hypothetical protein